MGWSVLAAVVVTVGLATSALAGTLKETAVVPLWPDDFLAAAGGKGEEKVVVENNIIKVGNVSNPTLTVYKPTDVPDTGAAVIICPGGGYSILAWDLEGTEIAEWLNSIGVTGVLLRYRVPGKRDAAFQDGQRAVGLVRSRAVEWKLNPSRIGILGFSAGGHLAARVSTNSKTRSYKAVDVADEVSCRPDFTVLIYPAYLTADEKSPFDAAGLPVNAETPPAFLAVAFKDKFSYGSIQYALAAQQAGAQAELHLFQFGGHGCGLRKSDANVTTWPEACARWLQGIKVLSKP